MNTTAGLIGRDEVLAVLDASFQQAASGRGHLVLIGGEAGIGKTAVAVAAAGQAAALGALVLWGRCSETEGMPAFWPWTQVVRAAADAGTRPPEVLGTLGWARPAGGGPTDVAASGTAASRARFRLFEAMAGFLATVAGSRPVVVVVEDLHWADADSLALAEFAARHLAGQRVLLVGTYRDEEATEPLRHLAGSASLVPLGGLSPTDVRELMARLQSRAPGEEEARRMWDRTAGNPLFVRELTRLASARGAKAATGLPAPGADSVRAVIERRLARLPQDCVHTLTVASLDAPVLRPGLLRRAAGVDVGAHLEQAATAGVLVREGSELRFAHDLFREVLADALTAHARAGLHLRLVRALEEQDAAGGVAHPAELAAHYCAVAVTSPDLALRSAAVRHSRAAAADAAARLAFADAAAHLERALPLADTDSTARADVLLALAEARRKAGRLARARATYLDAAALAQAGGDHARLARAALGLHAVGAKTGPSAEREQVIALLQQAADAPGLTGDLAALVNAALARDLYHSLDASRTRQAWQLARRAVTLARGSGDRWALAHCLIAAHDVSWRPGSARERLTVLDELLALARQLSSADLTAQARLLRATALIELGDPAAHAELDLFCRESEQLGDAAARWDAQSRRAAAALLTGRLDEAGTLIGAAGQSAEDMGSADGVWIHDIQRWELSRFQAGRGSYRRRHPGAEPPVESWPPWPALQAAGAGDLERAAAVMAGFPVEQSDGPGATAGYDLWFPSIAAEAAARCGTRDQRTRLYQRLSPLAGTHVVCGAAVAYAGAVDHYLGLLAASLGELSAAAAHLAAAAAQHHQLGATAWAQLSAQEQARLGEATLAAAAANRFQRDGAVWHLAYGGKTIRMPDAKGLRDIATLLARPREPVRSAELAGLVAPTGAAPVLDERARAAYKARLTELDQDADDATAGNDPERAARAAAERDALISELTRALGLGGRSRRLGDDTERARKAVTARIGHAIDRLQHYHPDLAAHLRATIRTGTACAYQPAQPIDWNLLLGVEMNSPGVFADLAAQRACWHPVAFAGEAADRPVHADLLGEPLVVWRGAGGELRVMSDLCVHRGTALSLGWVQGDELVCPYHGWRYGADGRCVAIPQKEEPTAVPAKARVRAFSAQERYGLIWVALEAPRWPLPEVPELENGEWTVVSAGPYRWRCDAARQVENFTDFGHFPWVHPGLLGDPGRPVVPPHQVRADGHVLRYEIVRPEAPNSEDFPVFGNEQAGPPERRSRYELHLPYTIVLRLGWGGQRGMVYFFASQPAAADRCAGYVVIGRNYNTEQPDQVIREFEDTIFGQDQAVVESQRPERVPFDLAAELHLRFDAVAVAYRKAMRELGLAASTSIGISVE